MNIKHATDITPRQIGASLGKICRYAGRAAFWTVLLHSFIVADFLPDELKFFGLVHDMAEVVTNDVVSPYKNAELRAVEEQIYEAMSKHQGVRLPTKHERAEIKHADRRSRQGEIHTGVGDAGLKREYPVRDKEAERITLRYARKYPAADCIRKNGRAVREFTKRYHAYKKLMEN